MIKCTDQMPPLLEEVMMRVVQDDQPERWVRGCRADFSSGMFLHEDDPFRPLEIITHWKPVEA